jgi:carboxyl-terminal processing protease
LNRLRFAAALFPLLGALASCGGGDDQPFDADAVGQAPFPGATATPGPAPGGGGGGGSQSGAFLPASNFDAMCVAPRPGTSDVQGTVTDQNNWLRSWTYDTYLWFDEVTYPNPAAFTTPTYFDLLRTPQGTPAGQDKDRFHFSYDTETWIAISQDGNLPGYGALIEILAPSAPRRIVVAYVETDTPAEGVLARGDEILRVDGVDAVNGLDQASVDTLNAGLFPEEAGEMHVFVVRDTAGVERTVNLTAAFVGSDPVPERTYFDTPTGRVGYLVFNEHTAAAEGGLREAFTYFSGAAISDLIIDMRYNGGGYLDIASQLAYQVANTTLTAGQTFERISFNSKHPSIDPVTGENIVPTPFHSTTLGFPGSNLDAGLPLTSVNLNRVYVIAGSGTCSASEAVVNGLRGVGVDVYLIGSTTCGKPYGFYPTDNCGTTYFSIQFRGVNAVGFGDYTDGFSPNNTASNAGVLLPGCSVADDFTHALGDPTEGRIAAALGFRASNNAVCPAATGYTDPRISKASYQNAPDRSTWLSRPAARMNRILRKP